MDNSRIRTRTVKQKTPARKVVLGRWYPVVAYILLFCFCVSVGVLYSTPKTHTYEVGSVSKTTIVASRDVVDEYSTNLLREEARQKVLPIYYSDESIIQQVEDNLNSLFTQLELTRKTAQDSYKRKFPETEIIDYTNVDWESALSTILDSIKVNLPDYITNQNIFTVASMSAARLTRLKESIMEKTRSRLMQGVISDELQNTIESIRKEFIDDSSYNLEETGLAYNIVMNNMAANMYYDRDSTEQAKDKAALAIEEISYKKGQNIVREGEIINEAQYQLIKQLGLITESSNQLPRWIAGTLIMAAIFATFGVYLFKRDRSLLTDNKVVTETVVLTVLIVVISTICRRIDLRLIPVFIATILGAVIYSRETSLAYCIFVSLVVTFTMSSEDVLFFHELLIRNLACGITGSIISVLQMDKQQKRAEYIKSGTLAGVVSSAFYISYGLLVGFSARDIVVNVLFALASGIVSGLLTVGLLPIWETIFSLTTPTKLLELTDPSRPLLRRLMIEAPGTYHHSIMVANLAEAGAEAIGADALLTRVAAFYHDVGKLADPLMFKENQNNIPNPHDFMSPKESAQIVRKHVPDGVKLAIQEQLPEKAVEIISQHHGDSLVSFFYYQAQKEGPVNEKDFRYQAKKPQTKEAGVLMMADITEAAIRAKKAAQDSDLSKQIEELIKSKYDAGEFDECPITRRDITLIVNAFTSIYEGARHERILYPQDRERIAERERQRQREAQEKRPAPVIEPQPQAEEDKEEKKDTE